MSCLRIQGIPYAVAPVGKLRWQEAIPLSEDTNCPSELNADRYGSRCVQLDSGSTLTGSEDCLFMNIWTPADVDLSSSRLDVMVHIHDGGLMTGSGHEPCKSLCSVYWWSTALQFNCCLFWLSEIIIVIIVILSDSFFLQFLYSYSLVSLQLSLRRLISCRNGYTYRYQSNTSLTEFLFFFAHIL